MEATLFFWGSGQDYPKRKSPTRRSRAFQKNSIILVVSADFLVCAEVKILLRQYFIDRFGSLFEQNRRAHLQARLIDHLLG